jgi:hypothetical protein
VTRATAAEWATALNAPTGALSGASGRSVRPGKTKNEENPRPNNAPPVPAPPQDAPSHALGFSTAGSGSAGGLGLALIAALAATIQIAGMFGRRRVLIPDVIVHSTAFALHPERPD